MVMMLTVAAPPRKRTRAREAASPPTTAHCTSSTYGAGLPTLVRHEVAHPLELEVVPQPPLAGRGQGGRGERLQTVGSESGRQRANDGCERGRAGTCSAVLGGSACANTHSGACHPPAGSPLTLGSARSPSRPWSLRRTTAKVDGWMDWRMDVYESSAVACNVMDWRYNWGN